MSIAGYMAFSLVTCGNQNEGSNGKSTSNTSTKTENSDYIDTTENKNK